MQFIQSLIEGYDATPPEFVCPPTNKERAPLVSLQCRSNFLMVDTYSAVRLKRPQRSCCFFLDLFKLFKLRYCVNHFILNCFLKLLHPLRNPIKNLKEGPNNLSTWAAYCLQRLELIIWMLWHTYGQRHTQWSRTRCVIWTNLSYPVTS